MLWVVDNPEVESKRLWDIFCKVVDNYGDIGVCWRLAADLASRGHQVRVWIDDPAALTWMAPGALERRWPRVQVLAWDPVLDSRLIAGLPPADAWIEAFGCDVPLELLKHRFHPDRSISQAPAAPPVWINLEYLTAEKYAERSHGLPSPPLHGPAAGQTRFFFFPGFSDKTGGLLREPDLAGRQTHFNRADWLAGQGITWRGERLVSLFCYEPAALTQLLDQLRHGAQPTRLLVTQGRAGAAVRQWLGSSESTAPVSGPGGSGSGSLAVSFLPPLAQTDFDQLLWACDLNFVRGEDSLVRAIWAGKPFVWNIYPQHDNAHHNKLHAFLDVMEAPPSWRVFHLAWNGIAPTALREPDLACWGQAVLKARDGLLRQTDLSTRLRQFAAHTGAGTV